MTPRRFGWGVVALFATGIAAYAAVVLAWPPVAPPFVARLRANEPWPILTHIGASLIALAIGPWQFSARLRSRALTVHRWMGRIYVASVIAGGSAGLVLALGSQEGFVTHAGFGLLAIAWLGTTLQAYRVIRAGDDVRHRRWMIRSFALTFAAVTLRNILPLELVFGVPFPMAYRIVSWACWVPNLVVAEWLIAAEGRRSRGAVAVTLAVVLTVAAPARAGAQAAPPWPDSYTSRVEALAVLQTLNADLLASRSSTAVLETWCREHQLASDPQIVADVARERGGPDLSAEQLRRLDVRQQADVRFRHVRLRCGTTVLSEADNWYVPARLTPDMNQTLDTSDAPFGRVVAPLQPYRRTFSMTLLWNPLPHGWERGAPLTGERSPGAGGGLEIPAALLEHRAVLYTMDNRPFSEVREIYQRGVLGVPPPRR